MIRSQAFGSNKPTDDILDDSDYRDLSRMTQLILSVLLMLPVLLYGAEAWTLLSTNASAFKVFARIVLRENVNLMRDGEDFRIRYNSDLFELLNDMHVVYCIYPAAALAQPYRSYGGWVFGGRGLRKSAKRTILYPLEGQNRGSPVIIWCDELA